MYFWLSHFTDIWYLVLVNLLSSCQLTHLIVMLWFLPLKFPWYLDLCHISLVFMGTAIVSAIVWIWNFRGAHMHILVRYRNKTYYQRLLLLLQLLHTWHNVLLIYMYRFGIEYSVILLYSWSLTLSKTQRPPILILKPFCFVLLINVHFVTCDILILI